MKPLMLVAMLCCISVSGFTQEAAAQTPEGLIAAIYEQYAAESDEEVPDVETFYEELTLLAAQPLSLNSSGREELERLLFLSPVQVENILYHRYTYGAFTSLYELQLVEGLDMTDIRRMLPFIRLGDALPENDSFSLWELRHYGRHELYLRTNLGLEIPKGYLPSATGGSSPYTGDRMYQSLKYRYDFRDRIRVNLTAEKDAGEPWWSREVPGFISASLQLRSVAGFDNVVLGDFTAGFGQGLVLRQGFRRSKSSLATQIMNTGGGFRRYASTSEHPFFRGIAATRQFSDFTVHAFASHRRMDATVEDSVFRSLYTTGLHRTPMEQDKIDRVQQTTGGIGILYSQPAFEVGFTGVYTRFSQPLIPDPKPYSHFYFNGLQQFSSGIHYRTRWNMFGFFGETALSGRQAIATLNGVVFAPSSRASIALLHRYYPVQYNALFASAFSAQSRLAGEQGIYIGFELLPVEKWILTAYADSYRFGWLRYGVDAPSSGNDLLLQIRHNASRKLQLTMRYRYRNDFTSLREEGNPMDRITREDKWSGRIYLDYTSGPVEFRNAIEINQYTAKGTRTSGYAAWQDVATQFSRLPLKLSMRYLVFNAPAYANRIYTYESDVLHAFSSPSFSGKGSRIYLVAQYAITGWIAVWIKASQVRYSDGRQQIGSGNELIQGNKRTEFHILLRIKHRNH